MGSLRWCNHDSLQPVPLWCVNPGKLSNRSCCNNSKWCLLPWLVQGASPKFLPLDFEALHHRDQPDLTTAQCSSIYPEPRGVFFHCLCAVNDGPSFFHLWSRVEKRPCRDSPAKFLDSRHRQAPHTPAMSVVVTDYCRSWYLSFSSHSMASLSVPLTQGWCQVSSWKCVGKLELSAKDRWQLPVLCCVKKTWRGLSIMLLGASLLL